MCLFVDSIHYPVSSIQYPVSSIQYQVSSIHYPVSRIQKRTTSLLLYSTFAPTMLQFVLYSTYVLYNTEHTICSQPHMVIHAKLFGVRCGGLVVSVPATRSDRPGSESRPGASPQSGLRGGRLLCEYCTNKL